MSFWQRAVDFALFRDLPANQPTRSAPALEQRARSLASAVPAFYSGKPSWPTDSTPVLTREGYRKCSTAFACINIIADAVAEATLRVWEDQGSGKRDELVDHPLRALLQRPHPRFSETEFLAQTVRIAAITGYCVIEKVRARAGTVVQLGHLRPDWIRPIPRDQALPDWEYTIPGEKPAVLAAADAVVFTYMDAWDLSVTGDTPLRAVLREAGILNELTDFVKLLLERGGMPQIVLVVDPPDEGEVPTRLTDDERETIRQQFIAKYSGARNWAGPAIVEGMQVETVSFDLNQMAFKDLRDGLDLSVCQAFRVPAPVVQVLAGLTTSYGKLLEESMTLLQLYTANPLRNRLDGALTRQLLPEFETRPNVDLGFDTSDVDALQEDEDAVHARAREDLRAGLLTLDEARQRIGEDALENELGTSLMLPFSVILTPVDGPVEPLKPDPTQEPPAEEDEDEEEGERARVIERQGRTYLNRRALSVEQRKKQDAAVAHHRAQIVRLADAFEPKVRQFFQDQRDRMLRAIVGERDGRPVTQLRAVEAFDWNEEHALFRQLFEQWWAAVSEAAFADASALIGSEIAWSVANPSLIDLFDTLGYRITGITETTRAAVEAIVRESLINGTTVDDLAAAIEHLFDETYAGRARAISRTESQVAYNLSAQRAYQASGVVTHCQLHDNPNHTTDPGSDGLTCSERSGLIVPLAQVQRHVYAEHVNGTLAVSAFLEPLSDDEAAS